MPTTCQVKSGGKGKKNTGWDLAIADAKRRIKELEFSMRVFRERKRAGKSWPGELARKHHAATHN